MDRNPNYSDDLAAVTVDRLRSLFVSAFSHLHRKPQHVYDVAAGKRPSLFARHRCDLWRMYQRGADLTVMLAAHDELRADMEAWQAADAVNCVVTEHIEETKAQGAADVLVLIATRTDNEADLARAYDAQLAHSHSSVRMVRSLARQLAERRRLRRTARARLGISG